MENLSLLEQQRIAEKMIDGMKILNQSEYLYWIYYISGYTGYLSIQS